MAGAMQWVVEINEPGDGVILEFNEVTPEGVESWTTALLGINAIELGEMLIQYGKHIVEGHDSHDEP